MARGVVAEEIEPEFAQPHDFTRVRAHLLLESVRVECFRLVRVMADDGEYALAPTREIKHGGVGFQIEAHVDDSGHARVARSQHHGFAVRVELFHENMSMGVNKHGP